MTNYATDLTFASDEKLVEIAAGGPQPGSLNHSTLIFEFQRRAVVAQTKAAKVAERTANLTTISIGVMLGIVVQAVASWGSISR